MPNNKKQNNQASTSGKIADHYTVGNLKKKIQNALKEAGLDETSLTTDDLASVDEFHFRGKEATIEMVQKLDIKPTDRVLDVGSGTGGTARYIAKQCKCQVTGIDLTPEFIKVAKWLNQLVNLDNPPNFIKANATNLPFEENMFDVAITEHVNMNIKNKERFLSQLHRVVKQGGNVCLYEILAGPNQPAKFPVPWSETKETSFLISPDETRKIIEKIGFTILSWQDTTSQAKAWYEKLVERNRKDGPPPLGIHLILGKKAPKMFQSLGKNLREKRIKVFQIMLQK